MARFTFGIIVSALFALSATAADFKLTGENTKIEFTGTKKDGKHTGGFKTLTGTAHDTDGKIAISVEIETDSLYTDDDKLTGHLKASDFFSVKDHPKATFKSTKVEKSATGTTVTGDLTLLGKTKSISFPATITTGDTFTLKAEFKIDRTDYGMNYGAGKVDNDVTLKVNVTAKK